MSEESSLVAQSSSASTSAIQSTASPNSSSAAAASAGQEEASSFSSMEDLKNAAPKVYNQMMQGIAQTICSQSEQAEARRKQIAQQYET